MSAGYDALVEGAAALVLDRDVITVQGPDAVAYLQGQLSQDVEALAVGASAWSLLLQPQGKVDAWLRITRSAEDAIVIDLDGGFGDAALARLTKFKLRTRADFALLDWRCVAVRGPAASPSPGAGLAAQADWPLVGGWDLLGPDVTPPRGIPEAAAADYEVRRIEAALPRMGAELDAATIPAEAGVVERSVSFTKGCYTGQELVARIDSRGGNVPRRLRTLWIEPGPLPGAGAAIEVDGRPGGTITSVAAHPAGHGVALGYIRRDVVDGASGVSDGRAVRIG
jgi:folate-binding protein YgfZ